MSSGPSIHVSRAELEQMQVRAWAAYSACDDALEGLLTMLDESLKTLISGSLEQTIERHETAKFVLRGALLKYADSSDLLGAFVHLQEAELMHFRGGKDASQQPQRPRP